MSDDDGSARATRVLRVFEEGKQFTEELLRENEKLRLVITGLRSEAADLRRKYINVDVPRLQEKLRLAEEDAGQLRRALDEVREQFATVEDENREFADRYLRVERQYSDLIQLYVASYQLHATLSYPAVLEALRAIVINMVGAEVFGIYLLDEHATCLQLVAHEGLESRTAPVPVGAGALGQAVRDAQVVTRAAGESDGANGTPLALVPLKLGDAVMGLIAIYKLLGQKDALQALDFELFELLGGHAATAIYAATLYAKSERKRVTLEGLMALLRDAGTGGSAVE